MRHPQSLAATESGDGILTDRQAGCRGRGPDCAPAPDMKGALRRRCRQAQCCRRVPTTNRIARGSEPHHGLRSSYLPVTADVPNGVVCQVRRGRRRHCLRDDLAPQGVGRQVSSVFPTATLIPGGDRPGTGARPHGGATSRAVACRMRRGGHGNCGAFELTHWSRRRAWSARGAIPPQDAAKGNSRPRLTR